MYQPFGLRGSRLPSSLLTGAVSGWPTIQELLVMLCRSGHGSPWVSPFPKCVRNRE
jgi:purine-cytosine permease-like protein